MMLVQSYQERNISVCSCVTGRICHHLQIICQANIFIYVKVKGKAVPLQAWSGPEGSRKLRFPDFMTTAQDGG
jgi:hypothetical protein